jgi:glucose-6-phosphate 1-dehydrogenase
MSADQARADALVIFGATGDLAKLETFPALVGLVERGVLEMPVIGIANSGWGLDQFRGYAEDSLRRNGIDPKSSAAAKMLGLLDYVREFAPALPRGRHLPGGPLAGPRSGREHALRQVPNSIIEPLLNRTHVQSIQITMAEDFGVSDRGAFYDRTGAIRDVLQNHLFQVLASVLAEPPDARGLDPWRTAKATVVAALSPLTPQTTVRGQYEGYHGVAGVDPNSTTETYVAVRLRLDSWRWAGVPILIRAGKCLPVKATEVYVRFRSPVSDVFGLEAAGGSVSALHFCVNPVTRVGFTLTGKKPGAGWHPQTETLMFAEQPAAEMRPYDRLIGAALAGERELFARQDTVEAAWLVVDPVLGDVVPAHQYAKGSWGPKEADALLPDGETWYKPGG